MLMEINGTYSGLTAAAGGSAKNDGAADETKKYNNVDEYAKYLSEKYEYFGKQASVYGVPTSVTVSGVFLQKCVDDPEKAEWLERNLTAYAASTKWMNGYARSIPGCPVRVYQHLSIDDNGNMTSVSRTTNDPDGKIARENAAKKAKAKKEEAKRLAKKRAEKKKREAQLAKIMAKRKKEREEQLAGIKAKRKKDREAAKTREIRVAGKDIWDMTRKTAEAISRAKASGTVGLDIRV